MGPRTLKQISDPADILCMTSISPAINAWASHPAGMAARIFIAVAGMVTATLVMMTASVVSSGSWALVLLGVALAASSVRAARVPSTGRLVLVAATLIAIPLAIQIF